MKVEIYNKIRDCSGVKMHSWYNSSVGIIRKPNNYKQTYGKTINKKTTTQNLSTMEEVKAEIEIKPRKIMNKLLFFLPASSKWSRIIRRGVVIFLLAGISGVGVDIVQNSGSYIPAVWLPLITSLLAMIDKAWRELAKE